MLGSQGEGLWIVLMNSPIQTHQVMINSGFCLVGVFQIYFKGLQFLKAKRWENSWCFSSSCQHLTIAKWLRKKKEISPVQGEQVTGQYICDLFMPLCKRVQELCLHFMGESLSLREAK